MRWSSSDAWGGGRAIRQMTPSCSGNWAEAIFVYARDLEAEISRVGSKEMGMYPSFEATIRTSLSVADGWSDEYELRRRTGERISCSQLFTALCVLRRQTKVPREMVKRLWSVTDDRVVHDVVRKFVDLNLVSERRSSDGGFTTGAHDLILEYCQGATGPDAQRYHASLLSEYLASDGEMARQWNVEGNDDSGLAQPAGTFCRSWRDFGNDRYLSEHVCRHLAEGGCVSELVSLLSDFRWTDVRVRSGDLLRWHEDFKCALSALGNRKEMVEMTQEGLQTIRDAAHDGWGLTANNVAELSFQMQSRLCEAGTRSWVAAKYTESIQRYAKKPWLRCGGRCWPRPGSLQSSVIYVADPVKSLKLAKQGRMAVVASGKAILIVNMETRCIIHSLPHKGLVSDAAVNWDGRQIVSGSEDGTVCIWDASGVSFTVTMMLECAKIAQMGEVIRAEADKGYVNYWRRDENARLVEIDRTVWHQPGGGASSARRRATKWEVHVCRRQVLRRNNENSDAVVLATLPFEAMYDNWGSHDFQVSQDGGDGGAGVCRFEVWLRNNSILSFSLIV